MASTKLSNLNKITDNGDKDLVYIVRDGVSYGIEKRDFKKGIANTSDKQILSGGMQWTGSGFTYESVNLSVIVNGEPFSPDDGTSVTASDSDATFDRIDLIYIDDTGTIDISEGTPSANPQANELLSYQLLLTTIYIQALSTEPIDVDIRTVYVENAGQPAEFDATENTAGVRIDLASTTDPITGTYSIRTLSALQDSDTITLTSSTATTMANFGSLKYSIKLLNSWGNDYIQIGLYNGATLAGYLSNNSSFLDTTNIVDVQTVTLFKSDFTISPSAVEFDTIKFIARIRGSSALEYILDDIYVNEDSGASQPVIITGLDVQLDTTNFDNNLDSTITDVQKLADAVDELVVGGGSTLEYQTEITTATTVLDGTQKGEWKVYPFNSASAQTVQIDNGDYVENDIINIERDGQGSLEVLSGTNVKIYGVRDINNRYFVNDPHSLISLLCKGDDGTNDIFNIIGNLTRGYTGPVNTISYSTLKEGDTGVDVTVTGTGFSSNMLVSVSANSILNSWTYVNPNQITLNLDAVGVENDTVTVTYFNGDDFVDTDAITISAQLYNTANLLAYYRLDSNSTESVSAKNGTDTGITYSSGATFNGSSSHIDVADDNIFSFGNGTTDNDLSITFLLNIRSAGNAYLVAKRGSPPDKEYQIDIISGDLRVVFFDLSTGGTINKSFTHSLGTSTLRHIGITKTGSTVKMYVDGVSQTLSDASSGSYVAMENLTSIVRFGAKPFALIDSLLNGKMRGVGFWDVALTDTEMAAISSDQLAGIQLL